jgi:hypothetical protein
MCLEELEDTYDPFATLKLILLDNQNIAYVESEANIACLVNFKASCCGSGELERAG